MADLIIHNAQAYTVDPSQPRAEAVVVRGNKIVFVGSSQDALALRTPKTRVIDGKQKTLLPGLNDSHFHLLMGALRLDHLPLESVASLDELANKIRSAPADKLWIQGGGLAYDIVGDGGVLTRHHLDEIERNRPILLSSLDLHTQWANTKALERAGILHGGKTVAGGEIVMDEDGTATGQINEDFDLIAKHIPELTSIETRTLLRRAITEINAMGITSVTNMDGSAEQMALYQGMVDDDDFDLRIYMPYSLTPSSDVGEIWKSAVSLRDTYKTGKVRAGSVKLFIDGVIESGTAYMLDAYTRWPNSVGTPLYKWDQYRDLIVEADKHGMQIKVHAIGDGAVRMTLNAYEAAQQANGKRDSRHRIEHVELLHNDDLPRFKQLGVTAAMQPLHASRPDSDHYVNWMHCVGEERYHRAFRWQELHTQNTPLPFGSDWPVVTFDPFIGMEAALTQTAWGDGLLNQAQSLSQTLTNYTRTGAFAEFQEHEKGQLRTGMLADLVLLDCDIFEVDRKEIRHVRPTMTVCDGDVVFEKAV